MSGWGDDTLDEWLRAVAADAARRLDALETEPCNGDETGGIENKRSRLAENGNDRPDTRETRGPR